MVLKVTHILPGSQLGVKVWVLNEIAENVYVILWKNVNQLRTVASWWIAATSIKGLFVEKTICKMKLEESIMEIQFNYNFLCM